MPRPKRSKTPRSTETVDDVSTTTKSSRAKKSDDDFLPTCSTSESQLNPTRVVVNPAVLRYLQQSRLGSMRPLMSLEDNPLNEINSHDEDELFWDFSSYSNEFFATARLARWLLDHHGHLSRAPVGADLHSFR